MVVSGSVHGQLDPCGWKKNPLGGLSRKLVGVNELKKKGLDPIILDAGDLFFSTPEITVNNRKSEIFRAKAILEGYEKIGCDLLNIGKYELAAGMPFLKDIMTSTQIPLISANIRDSKTGKLIFRPYSILERNSLRIGIIGLTNVQSSEKNGFSVDDYKIAGNKYIKQLKSQVDIIALLINADRSTQQKLLKDFPDAHFIYVSGSTHLTRPSNAQNDGGPYVYSFGKQGKYMTVITANISDSKQKLVDVSGYESKIKSINRRFDRLQKKDPGKSLEDIYSNQGNVLQLIEQYKSDLKEAKHSIQSAVNTIKFELLPLDRKVRDDTEMLAFVDKTIATCKSLIVKNPNTESHKHGHSH